MAKQCFNILLCWQFDSQTVQCSNNLIWLHSDLSTFHCVDSQTVSYFQKGMAATLSLLELRIQLFKKPWNCKFLIFENLKKQKDTDFQWFCIHSFPSPSLAHLVLEVWKVQTALWCWRCKHFGSVLQCQRCRKVLELLETCTLGAVYGRCTFWMWLLCLNSATPCCWSKEKGFKKGFESWERTALKFLSCTRKCFFIWTGMKSARSVCRDRATGMVAGYAET